jgi:PAS domain S-box-containing protein
VEQDAVLVFTVRMTNVSRDFLVTALDNLDATVTCIKPDGTIVFVNEAGAAALSRTREELLGTSVFDHFPNQKIAGLERVRQTVRSREVQCFESRLAFPNGDVRRFETTYYPIFDDRDEVSLIQVVARDRESVHPSDAHTDNEGIWGVVTDDISMTKVRVRALLEHVPCIISVFDPDTTIRYMNRTTEATSPDKVVGQSPLDWVGDASRPVLEGAMRQVVETRQVTECEVQGKQSATWWLVRLAPLTYADKVEQVLGCSVDITAQKDLQARLAKRRKLESLGTMARGVAHDFNNLLTAILTNLGLARRWIRSGRDADAPLQQTESAAERAADLCEQMLLYAGTGRGAPGPGDLNAVIRELSGLTRAAMRGHTDLSFELAQDLPLTLCNRTQLGQIVMNLINNASDAIRTPRGRIRVSTSEVEVTTSLSLYQPEPPAPGRYLCLEVVDNGEGVPAHIRDRIFDPFYSTKDSGQGLGLSVVQGILRSVGGAILMKSGSEGGTTMTVLLPALSATHAEGQAPAARDNQAWIGGQGTVLVVDDEDVLRAALIAMLQEGGYDTVEASDGFEALSVLERTDVQLVVMDVTMPGLDGFGALAELRKSHPQLPVLLASGRPMDLPDGDPFVFRLPKPFAPDELLRVLARLRKDPTNGSTGI